MKFKPKLKKGSKSTVKLCPKCRSIKLKPAVNVSGWLAPRMYECWDCNYIGPLYLEMEVEEYQKIIKEKKEEKKEE